jgi:organic hydroperoxide reductase OsmC/OhrA
VSEHDATVEWRRQGAGFDYQTYSRAHTLSFDGGIRVPAGAEEHAKLHEAAHAKCFIANSVNTEVALEPGMA